MGISDIFSQKLNSINILNEQDKDQIQMLLLDFFAAMFAGYKQNRKTEIES